MTEKKSKAKPKKTTEVKEKKTKVKNTNKKNLSKETKKEIEMAQKRKFLYFLETLAIAIVSFAMILLLLNKTFFREEYETDEFKINIPMLYFFVKDEDNVIEFKTLRKSEYNVEYFDNYLASLDKYSCNSSNFYYDSKYKLAIYRIDVDKKFAIKTVKITYEIMDLSEVCN